MSKEIYISFIIEELKNNNVDAEKVCAVFCRKFQKSNRTFYNHWKMAQERYNNTQKLINKENEETYAKAEKERLKQSLISREQFGIMIDNVFKLSYKKTMDTNGGKNEVQAFMQVAERKEKFEGFDNPTKTETTIKGITEIIIEPKEM